MLEGIICPNCGASLEDVDIKGLTVDGFEAELKGNLTDKFSLVAGFTSMDGETSSGGEPREIPDQMLTLYGTYEISDKTGIAFGFTKQGESNIKNNKPDLILPSYTRFDMAAYYNISDDLVLRFNVENLTDELYFPHSHSTHQASVGEEKNVRVSISKKF